MSKPSVSIEEIKEIARRQRAAKAHRAMVAANAAMAKAGR